MTTSPGADNGQTEPTIIPDVFFCTIGGNVWQLTTTADGEKKVPVVQAAVQIKGTAQATQTDRDGHFRFKNLKPGTYTLVVQIPGGDAPTERVIQVPPDYDVIVAEPTGVQPSLPAPKAPKNRRT